MIVYAHLTHSNRETKKYMMTFYDENYKKVKTSHFGQKNASDYTKRRDDTRKDNYINRHNTKRENWQDYTTPGSLALNILWNKTTVKASFDDYLKKFNLKRY